MTEMIGPEGLAARLAPAIADMADELDRSDRIPEKLLVELRESGAFRLLTPRELGGSETPSTTALQVYEELAILDASVAWVVWNANFGFVGAMLPQSGAAKIWDGPVEPVFANSGAPGLAVPIEAGGYRLSGHWKLVSGIDGADWVAVLALVNGTEIRVLLVPTQDVEVQNTWNVSGMRATGSNDVIIEDVVVPEDLTARLDQPPRIDTPLYQGFLPALVLPGCTAVVLGVARAALDETVRLAATKGSVSGVLAEQARVQGLVAASDADLRAARLLLFSAAGAVEDAGWSVTTQQRADLRAAMSHAAAVSRRVLGAMYEVTSSSSIYVGSPLERLFRDGMVALQHANHAAAAFEGAGRVRFGFDAGLPLF